MKIGFVVNEVSAEHPRYTTIRLAMNALRRGHEIWLMGVAEFTYDPDGSIHAHGMRPPAAEYGSGEEFMEAVNGEQAVTERITLDELDVLMLRNDPAEDALERPWAQTSGILFGQLVAARGVIVLNDPEHLAHAINKTYFQHFPDSVRPATCISRSRDEIKRFIEQHNGDAVIKPLQGSGGHGVFVVRQEGGGNLNQMIDAVTRDGYAIVQEYLPQAAEGDVRLFVMNGEPLKYRGVYGLFRRRSDGQDARSNITAGGKVERAEMTDAAFKVVEAVSPKLVRDGMHLVGLDLVGDKLMEINVFTPGGLGSLHSLTGVEFTDAVIDDLEQKVQGNRRAGVHLSSAGPSAARSAIN